MQSELFPLTILILPLHTHTHIVITGSVYMHIMHALKAAKHYADHCEPSFANVV